MTAQFIVETLLEAKPERPPPGATKPSDQPSGVLVLGRVSRRSRNFKKLAGKLPEDVQERLKLTYRLWVANPHANSLHFKNMPGFGDGNWWSIRVGTHYRAMCYAYPKVWLWHWVGPHESYNNYYSNSANSRPPS